MVSLCLYMSVCVSNDSKSLRGGSLQCAASVSTNASSTISPSISPSPSNFFPFALPPSKQPHSTQALNIQWFVMDALQMDVSNVAVPHVGRQCSHPLFRAERGRGGMEGEGWRGGKIKTTKESVRRANKRKEAVDE